MKTLTCDLCDVTADGETFEEWMKALQPHYMAAHAEVVSDRGRSPEQVEQERKLWMAENRARFDAAPAK